MLRSINASINALHTRRALISSSIMAFACLGDAILYPLLPVYAKELGLSVMSIGLLLSINRFVRIIANTWIANFIGKIGTKKLLLTSAICAVITTCLYGLKLGLFSFVFARIVWGLSYAGLKIATLNYASKVKGESGFIFGVSQSIKSLGALFALLLGPAVIEYYGINNGLFVIALVSMFAILLVFTIPNDNYASTDIVKTHVTFSLTPINILVGILAISIDGILVVVLADLFKTSIQGSVQLLVTVAGYLLMKRLFITLISFISGFVSIKISAVKIFNFSVIISIFSLLLIAVDFVVVGTLLAFMFNTIIITFSPLIAINQSNNTLQAISSISTWWDFGAGIGAFLGILLIKEMGQVYLFSVLFVLSTLLFINFIIWHGKTNRTVI